MVNSSMEIQYTAIAHASGDGRNGHVRSEDDRFNLETRTPKEMGGTGDGTNPEQLFAMGYATCFLGSLHRSGKRLGLNTTDASISSRVGIGADASGGFGLAVELIIHAPSVTADDFDELVEATDQTCAYSNATRGNIAVTLTRVEYPAAPKTVGLANGVTGSDDDRLAAARGLLEQTREKFWAVCEPVDPPKIARDYVNYFCARNPANVELVEKNQPRRLKFYDALNTYLRAYSAIANELELAGYSAREVASIEKEVRFFEDVVRDVKLAASEQTN